jgi:hypothetical protein
MSDLTERKHQGKLNISADLISACGRITNTAKATPNPFSVAERVFCFQEK